GDGGRGRAGQPQPGTPLGQDLRAAARLGGKAASGGATDAGHQDLVCAGDQRGSAASEDAGSRLAQYLTVVTDDEWQAHTTREAAKAIGRWLEGRGRLHQPIRSLTMPELEAMAATAIARFVVLGAERIRDEPEEAADLMWLLAG